MNIPRPATSPQSRAQQRRKKSSWTRGSGTPETRCAAQVGPRQSRWRGIASSSAIGTVASTTNQHQASSADHRLGAPSREHGPTQRARARGCQSTDGLDQSRRTAHEGRRQSRSRPRGTSGTFSRGSPAASGLCATRGDSSRPARTASSRPRLRPSARQIASRRAIAMQNARSKPVGLSAWGVSRNPGCDRQDSTAMTARGGTGIR